MRKHRVTEILTADFVGNKPHDSVFLTTPRTFVTKNPIPWLFLSALAGVFIAGAAVVAILVNSL